MFFFARLFRADRSEDDVFERGIYPPVFSNISVFARRFVGGGFPFSLVRRGGWRGRGTRRICTSERVDSGIFYFLTSLLNVRTAVSADNGSLSCVCYSCRAPNAPRNIRRRRRKADGELVQCGGATDRRWYRSPRICSPNAGLGYYRMPCRVYCV